jgi:hypothetical protein
MADAGTKKDNLSPLDVIINFSDRQELKEREDAVADLAIILPTLQNTISRVAWQARKCCNPAEMTAEQKYEFEQCIDEFEEYSIEASTLVERANALKQRADSTAKLV